MKIVAAAIMIRNGKIFICQRPEHKQPPHLWEFPGGKQEPGETLPQCLQRELSEELNVVLEIGPAFMTCSFDYDFGTFEIHTFFVNVPDGIDIKSNEHENTAWVTPAQLVGYNFVPADIPVVEKLQKMTF